MPTLLNPSKTDPVDLTTGAVLGPGRQGTGDPTAAHEAALIAVGKLVVVDGSTPLPPTPHAPQLVVIDTTTATDGQVATRDAASPTGWKAATPGSVGSGVADGSVTTAKLADAAVTEGKLAPAVATKLNAVGSGGGAAVTGVRKLVPLTTDQAFTKYGGNPFNSQSDGDRPSGALSVTYRSQKTVIVGGTDIVLVYENNGTSGATENDGGNPITVKAAFVLPDGTIIPAKFAGAATKTIAPGQTFATDPLLGATVTPADKVSVLTYVTCTVAGGWPSNKIINEGLASGREGYASGVDRTATGVMTNPPSPSGFLYGYGPSAILGTASAPTRSVALWGDSIEAGTGQAISNYPFDFVTRALALGERPVAMVNLAIFGDSFGLVAGNNMRRAKLVAGCSDAICGLATNDLTQGVTLTSLQAKALTVWGIIRAAGAQRVYQTTATPVTSGSASSQTPDASTPVRIAWNTWLRAGAPISGGAAVAVGTNGALLAGQPGHPLTDTIEVADRVETFRDSGYWTVAAYNGTHPTEAGHIAMSKAIDPVSFGGSVSDPAISALATAALPSIPSYVGSGQWHVPGFSSTVDKIPSYFNGNRNTVCVPHEVKGSQDVSIDGLSIVTRADGTAGSKYRLSVYSASPDGTPGVLLRDGGTVVADTGGAFGYPRTATFTALKLKAGLRYFFGLTLEAPGATKPTLLSRVGGSPSPPLSAGNDAGSRINSVISDGVPPDHFIFFTNDSDGAAPPDFTGSGSFAFGTKVPLVLWHTL